MSVAKRAATRGFTSGMREVFEHLDIAGLNRACDEFLMAREPNCAERTKIAKNYGRHTWKSGGKRKGAGL
jgi:hypothetical protein